MQSATLTRAELVALLSKDNKAILSIPDIMERTGWGRTKVYEAINSGKLKTIKGLPIYCTVMVAVGENLDQLLSSIFALNVQEVALLGSWERLNEAVRLEDSLRYTEPADWPASTRHTLGRVLLRAGRYRAAEVVFKEDLAVYPENGWALQGLALCHEGLSETDAAREARARLDKAWAHADIERGGIGL